MNERTKRIGANEALFRQVNERLREVGTSFSLVTDVAEFVCECGDASCTERLRVPLAEYERVRADGALFLVARGHAAEDLEYSIDHGDGYDIVRKREGAPTDLAREQDPRG